MFLVYLHTSSNTYETFDHILPQLMSKSILFYTLIAIFINWRCLSYEDPFFKPCNDEHSCPDDPCYDFNAYTTILGKSSMNLMHKHLFHCDNVEFPKCRIPSNHLIRDAEDIQLHWHRMKESFIRDRNAQSKTMSSDRHSTRRRLRSMPGNNLH